MFITETAATFVVGPSLRKNAQLACPSYWTFQTAKPLPSVLSINDPVDSAAFSVEASASVALSLAFS